MHSFAYNGFLLSSIMFFSYKDISLFLDSNSNCISVWKKSEENGSRYIARQNLSLPTNDIINVDNLIINILNYKTIAVIIEKKNNYSISIFNTYNRKIIYGVLFNKKDINDISRIKTHLRKLLNIKHIESI